MITTKFEDTYSCVATAKKTTEMVDEVANFLRKQTKPLTCKEIGLAVFGDVYPNQVYSAKLGQILKHLAKGGFIGIGYRIDKPIEIEVGGWISTDAAGIPKTITVHDDEGNSYQMPNPKADQRDRSHGYWGVIKKTIIPKTKVFKWVD